MTSTAARLATWRMQPGALPRKMAVAAEPDEVAGGRRQQGSLIIFAASHTGTSRSQSPQAAANASPRNHAAATLRGGGRSPSPQRLPAPAAPPKERTVSSHAGPEAVNFPATTSRLNHGRRAAAPRRGTTRRTARRKHGGRGMPQRGAVGGGSSRDTVAAARGPSGDTPESMSPKAAGTNYAVPR